MRKLLRSLAAFLPALAFFFCHYIFESYVTCLTLSFNTIYICTSFTLILCAFIVLKSNYFIVAFKSILSQSRCSLEPKAPAEHIREPSTIDICYTCFSTDYDYSWDHDYD